MRFLPLFSKLRNRWFGTPEGRTPHRRAASSAKRLPVLLSVEPLESRITPATNRWTGADLIGGVDGATGAYKWNDALNWSLGRIPINGDDLVFDNSALVGAAQRNTVDDIATPLSLNSITFQGSNYTLAPKTPSIQFTLGKPNGGNSLVGNSGTLNNVISIPMTLAGPGVGGNPQTFSVGLGAQLTLSGAISSAVGVELAKVDVGTLTLTHDNSNFQGKVTVLEGVLNIQNANALGDISSDTTVQQNAQLQLQGINGTINERLLLNGPGLTNDGALLALSGTPTWAGGIELDSDSFIGASQGAVLDITGQISDLGAILGKLNKEGAGQVIFSHVGGNTYRGLTTIDNGILTIRDPLSLGPQTGTTTTGTLVNSSPTTGDGTLQLEFVGLSSNDPNAVLRNPLLPFNAVTNPVVGFQVRDELLTLNGPGFDTDPTAAVVRIGALNNLRGNNNWANTITLGSPDPNGSDVSIGVEGAGAAMTNLTVSGLVTDRPAADPALNLNKIRPGRLIFNHANTYRGFTTVAAGILNIRDSQGLGPTTGANAGTSVSTGAALELEVDTGFDAHGRDLSIDSITGQTGNGPQLGLTIQETLTINGTGVANTGGLHSISGINKWIRAITLSSANAGIGVDPDPNPSNTNLYFTNDYSLTVTANIGGGATFHKEDGGQLILPNANTYTGWTFIESGWITAQDDRSLGGFIYGSDTIQPGTTVVADPVYGSALHLKPRVAGGSFNFLENLVLGGLGIKHPFGLISQKGALMSLGGVNQIGGPLLLSANNIRSSDIQLDQIAGIGVEIPFPATDPVSDLTITSSISDANGTPGGGLTKLGSRRLSLQGDGSYSGAVSVSEGVLRAQHDSALGLASSGTSAPAGTEVYSQTTTKVDLGIREIQTLTVAGAAPPSYYTLTFTDTSGASSTTNPLFLTDTPGTVQNELNLLPTIRGSGPLLGSVTVNQAGNVYAITFGGSMVGINQNPLVANQFGVTVAVGTQIDGDGTALELKESNALNTGGITAGLGIWHEQLILNTPGSTTFGDSPVTVLSGDHLWRGPTTLQRSSTVRVDQNARLDLFGDISDDLPNTPAVVSDLTKAGLGELALTGASSSYDGTTFVNQGVLTVQNGQALGSIGIAEVQTVTVGGPPAGSFTLTFNGVTMATALPYGIAASGGVLPTDSLENAINALSTISGVGGSVTVSGGPTLYTVTFGGSLAGFNQPDFTKTEFGGATVAIGTLTQGSGGTVVANDAALQLQGSVTVSGEPLILTGKGSAQTNTILQRWFNAGPSPINQGQTAGNQAVAGRVTGVAVDPTDANVIYIATAGGGAWKTKDGGHTWLPLFDSSSTQRLYLPGQTGSFQLTFNGSAPTPAMTITAAKLASGALATEIENNLNALATIGGLTPLAGSVKVTQSTVNRLVFSIQFGGALSGAAQPTIVATGLAGTVNPSVTTTQIAMYGGAIAIDPNDPRIIYFGTGEANNASDSYYGSGVYKSIDSGKTWRLLTNSDGKNPVYGLGITKIVVDYGEPPNTPYTPPQIAWPAGDGPNAPTGRIYVATSDLVTNRPGSSTPGVYRFDESTTQVQTLTVPSRTGAGSFTLTFTNRFGTTSTTVAAVHPLNLNSATLAQDIENALNDPNLNMPPFGGFAAIGGITPVAGHAIVKPSTIFIDPATPAIQADRALVFDIAIAGSLLPIAVPPPVTQPAVPNLMTATGSGIADPVVTRASRWVNLTATATVPRLTLVGQTQPPAPPRTAGPNDEFRISFPQSNVNWSDLSLAYFDDSEPTDGTTDGGISPMVPVLYAALGGTGSINNAVFRTENPRLSPMDDAEGVTNPNNKDVPTTWYVGDPGVPRNEIQQLTVSPWTDGGFYQLAFNGSAWAPPIGDPTFPMGLPANTDAFVGIGNTAPTIQGILNGLPTIGGIGGSVRVVLTTASTSTLVFDITFGGSMANSQQPLIQELETNPPQGDWVKVTESQKGSGVDTRSGGEFPAGTFPAGPARNGNIKFTQWVNPNPNPFLNPTFDQVTIYASISYPEDLGNYPVLHGQLREVQRTANGGRIWASVPAAGLANYMANQGHYDSTIVASSNTTVYVGGHESSNATHMSQIYKTTASGASWTEISVLGGIAPHTSQHASAFDTSGRVLMGGDGGLWRYDPTANSWTDLTANLTITQFNGIAGNPNDLSSAYGGSRFNGNEMFNGGLAWTLDDINDGGVVHLDPKNPNTVYHVQNTSLFQPASATLQRSFTGGAGPWTTVLTVPAVRYFPFLVDSINTKRLLAGGDSRPGGVAGRISIQESLNQGNAGTWVDLNLDPFTPVDLAGNFGLNVTSVAAATFQGNFVFDNGFPLVTDRLSNTYVPDTFYVYGTDVFGIDHLYATKNHGLVWQDRTGPLAGIGDIEVDQGNRDTIYAVAKGVGGGVFKSTTAGRTWTNLRVTTTNLPNLPTWKLVVDPRNGNVYIGTDNGVWLLPAGTTTWQRFGSGLANVQVKDLELNQSTNTLLAGTYGRSMYQLFLDDGATGAGALRAVSGSSVWTGPIQLVGDNPATTNQVYIAANGSQALLNGVTTAQLNIIGIISDATPPPLAGNSPRLVKIGQGDVIFSGPNIYNGITEVRQGQLVVRNPQALGNPTDVTSNTVVDAGAALALQSDLQSEPVQLHGNGILPPFNGRYTGALRNISNNNTYTGVLTLATDPAGAAPADNGSDTNTIGVDSGSSLTIGAKPGLTGTGMVQENGLHLPLIKEGLGTLILASANTYGGLTRIQQGALQAQDALALGTTLNGTDVYDGAQLQIGRNALTFLQTVIVGEALTLSGTGIFGTGAILNVRPNGDLTGTNDNTWRGPVSLVQRAVTLFPIPPGTAATNPPTIIAVGADTDGDTLTIDDVISESGGTRGLTKVGPGRVTLTKTNPYGGLTTVAQGELRITDSGALGTVAAPPTSVVIDPTNNTAQGYAGLNFTQSGYLGAPDVTGAAGTASYIETDNNTITIYFPKATGSGAMIPDTLLNFWTSAAAGGLARASATSQFTHTAIVYDDNLPGLTPTTGRFIVATLDVDTTGSNLSVVNIAISKSANPGMLDATDWDFYQISTTQAGFDADDLGNLGFNNDALVFTLNMKVAGVVDHVLVTSVDATDLVAAVPAAALRSYQNDVIDANLRPTTMHDAASTEPMWLVGEVGDGTHINVYRMSNVLSNAAVFTPTQLAVTAYADISTVPPRQPNGTVVANNLDSRILKAAQAGGILVATHSVSTSVTRDTARWYAIDVSTGTPVLQQQGDVTLGNGRYAYVPAVDINSAGDIGLSFMESGTGAGRFMSMYITGRNAGDAPGTMLTPVKVPAGSGVGNYADTFGNQVGGISGISIDPTNGSFWAVNEFANAAAGANWGTAIVNFFMGSSAAASSTRVLDGAALELDGTPVGLNVGEVLTLNGQGVNGTGALRNIVANNNYTGTITLQTNSAIGVDPGLLLTVLGNVQDFTTPLSVPAASLTKVLQGTLSFPNANTYSGKTFVNDGVLNIQNVNSLGNSGAEQQTVTVLGASGTFTLQMNGPTGPKTVSLDILSPTLRSDMQAALNALPGVGGPITVTQAAAPQRNVFTVTFGGSLANTNVIQMIPQPAPGVSVVVATLRDGPEGTVVNSTATQHGTLQIQGTHAWTELLTLNGPGFNNQGSLESLFGINLWNRPITLGSNASIGVDVAADTLAIVQGIGQIGTLKGLTKVGPGTLEYLGPVSNTYTGLTQVNNGTLLLNISLALEQQQVFTLGGTGKFTLTFTSPFAPFASATTGLLDYNVPATGGATPTSSMQNAILDLFTTLGIAGGTATVIRAPAAVPINFIYTVTFGGTLANRNLQPMVAAGSLGATAAVATVTDGSNLGTAIAGNLQIGDNAAGNALVQWILPDEVVDSSNVTVESDGTLDLNGKTETISQLHIHDGIATTGATGVGILNITTLEMAGGTFKAETAGSQLNLGGNVTGTSSATQTATVSGPGTVSLGGTTRTFNVTNGVQNSDMLFTAPIVGAASEGITKTGDGLLELDSNANTYTGLTTINQGTLQVDGTIQGSVSMSDGVLQGIGTVVGTLDATGGIVSPGDSPGTLTTGTVTWNNSTIFRVELNGTTVDTQYDQLKVNGTVALGGADLRVLLGFTPVTGNTFTIISSTGNITGVFAQGGDGATFFVSGVKFTIAIDNSGATKTVKLTRVPAITTIQMTSVHLDASNNVTFTATVFPELGASANSPTGVVTFTDNGVPIAPVFGFPDGTVGAGGVAVLTVPLASLSLSPHSVTATYPGDANFAGSGPSSLFLFGDEMITNVTPNTAFPILTSLSTINLFFKRPVDLTTFVATDDIQLTAPDGSNIPVGLAVVNGTQNMQWRLTFTAQTTAGVYTLKVGPLVSDSANFPMDQSGNGINGEGVDQYIAKFVITGLKVSTIGPLSVLSSVGISTLTIDFNMAVKPGTFDLSDIKLYAPNSATPMDLAAMGVTLTNPSADGIHWQLNFPAASELHQPGTYRIEIGPDVLDLADHKMNQNGDNTFGTALLDPAGDIYHSTFVIQALAIINLTAPNPLLYPNSPTGTSSIEFNAAINPATFTVADDIVLLDSSNNAQSLAGATLTNPSLDKIHWVLTFPTPATADIYTLRVGPHIADAAGFEMDQNNNGFLGEVGVNPAGDQSEVKFAVDGLAVTTISPSSATLASVGVSSAVINFNMKVLVSSFTKADIQLFDPSNNLVNLATGTLGPINPTNTSWRLTFPTQKQPGTYKLKIGPDVLDMLGNKMNQNHDGTFGTAADELAGDIAVRTFFVQGLAISSITAPDPLPQSAPNVPITIIFNMPVTVSTFTAADIQVFDPNGGLVPLGGATPRNMNAPTNTVWELDLAGPATPGVYTVRVGPHIATTLSGVDYEMDQNHNGMLGQNGVDPVGDQFDGLFVVAGLKVDSISPLVTLGSAGVPNLMINFNMAVAPASFTVSDIEIRRPNGVPIDLTAAPPPVNTVPGTDKVWRLDLPSTLVEPGTYTVRIGPDVRDRAGNQMNQNQINGFGEPGDAPTGDRYVGTFFIQGLQVLSVTGLNPVPLGAANATAFIKFNMAVNAATFTVADDVRLLDAGNNALSLAGATLSNPSNDGINWQLTFQPPQTAGVYKLRIGPHVAARLGGVDYEMDQNANGQLGQNAVDPIGDQFESQFVVAGLKVTSVTPTGSILDSTGVTFLTFNFNMPVKPGTFTVNDVQLLDPSNVPIDLSGSTLNSADSISWTLNFAAGTTLRQPGTYTIRVGPDVQDLAGNLMNQNGDNTFGTALLDPAGDIYHSTFFIQGLNINAITIAATPPVLDSKGVSSATIEFNMTVQAASFDLGDFNLTKTGPGAPVNIPLTAANSRLTDISTNGTLWRLDFPLQTLLGDYTLLVGAGVGGPNINDAFGFKLDQNNNGILGQLGLAPAGDQSSASFAIDGLNIVSVVPDSVLSPPGLSSVTVTFNEGINGGSLTGQVTLTGPGGAVAANQFTFRDLTLGGTNLADRWLISFPTQGAGGQYTVTLGPNVKSILGNNSMDLNGNHIAGEAIADKFTTQFALIQLPQAPAPVAQGDVNAPLSIFVTRRRARRGSSRFIFEIRVFLYGDSTLPPGSKLVAMVSSTKYRLAGADGKTVRLGPRGRAFKVFLLDTAMLRSQDGMTFRVTASSSRGSPGLLVLPILSDLNLLL